MNIIEITSSNITDFKTINIIAVQFTKIGGQGEGGSIKIMDSEGSLYHTNIVKTIKLKELFLICPFLEKCELGLFKSTVPEGWYSFYMGGGNFLIVKDQFKDTISKIIPIGIYNNWINTLHKEINNNILPKMKNLLLKLLTKHFL